MTSPDSPGSREQLEEHMLALLAYSSQLCTVLKWQFHVVSDLPFKYLQCYRKWYSSKRCYHFAFTNHALQIISAQDRNAKSLWRLNWNDATSLEPFLHSPDLSDYCPFLPAHTYLVQTSTEPRILFMFLFIIHNTLPFPFVYRLASPSNPNFLEVTNHVLIFAHPAPSTLKVLVCR